MNCSVLILLAMAAISSPANAVELWHGANAGDTRREILTKFPSVITDQKVTSKGFVPDLGPEHASTSWMLEAVPVGEHEATGSFLFTNDHLTAFIINVKVGAMAADKIDDRADDLEALLTTKYGPPFSCPRADDDGAHLRLCTWYKGQLMVRLVEKTSSTTDGDLFIRYEPKPDGLDSNL